MVAALPVTSVLAMRYMSAVAVALILYDHCLTWVDEVRYIWFNPQAGFGGRLSFLVNRYATEGMIIFVAYSFCLGEVAVVSATSCRNFIWVFAVIGSVSIALQQFSMVVRVYTLWDRRPKIKWIVIIAFAIQTAITTVFSILTAVQMQPHVAYSPVLHMCTISEKPWALPVMTGTLAAFGLFIILMTVVNALDRPYQRQADVVNALLRDGAFMFGFIFLLTVANFLMSLLGSPSDCLVTLVVVWSMYRLVASRMELRVEAIRLIRFSFPANGAFEVDDELESVWK